MFIPEIRKEPAPSASRKRLLQLESHYCQAQHCKNDADGAGVTVTASNLPIPASFNPNAFRASGMGICPIAGVNISTTGESLYQCL